MTPEPRPDVLSADLRECCICAGSGIYWNARDTIKCPHCSGSMKCACPAVITQRPAYEGG